MELNNKRKIATITATLYIALMAVGMYTAYHIFGYSYDQPEVLYIISLFEIAMSLFALYVAKTYFGWRNVGFGKINNQAFRWFYPFVIIIVALLVAYLKTLSTTAHLLSTKEWGLIMVIFLGTGLVGLSEELMFRGIVLRGLLEKNSLFVSMLLSALLFSLLHAVNVLAGLPISSMVMQLILTFLFGMVFAPMAIKIGNITPLIIYHWLWDFCLISAPLIGFEHRNITTGALIIEMMLCIALWISLKKRVNVKQP